VCDLETSTMVQPRREPGCCATDTSRRQKSAYYRTVHCSVTKYSQQC